MKMLGTRDKLFYAQLAFPLAFAGLPLYIHAPDFYATTYGVSLSFLGAALLVIRLADAVADPFIGRFCDTHPYWRLPVIGAAAVAFAFSFAALYHPPAALEIFWFVTSVFVCTLSFSVLLINLNAIGGLISSASEKASVSAWREGFGLAGLLCAMLLPAILGSMQIYAVFSCIVALLSAFAFYAWYRKMHVDENVAAQPRPPTTLRELLSGWYASFFKVYAISMLASSFSAVLFLFYVRDWLAAEDKAGLFLMLYFIAAIAAMPFWRALTSRFATQHLWAASMMLAAASISLAAAVEPGNLGLYAFVCLLSGIAFGGEIFLPPALLSAKISAQKADLHTSAYFGIYAFFMKIALAGATAIAFGLLEIGGFRPAAENDDKALFMLVTLYALAPAVIKIVALFILIKTPGDQNETSLHHLHTGGRHAS